MIRQIYQPSGEAKRRLNFDLMRQKNAQYYLPGLLTHDSQRLESSGICSVHVHVPGCMYCECWPIYLLHHTKEPVVLSCKIYLFLGSKYPMRIFFDFQNLYALAVCSALVVFNFK